MTVIILLLLGWLALYDVNHRALPPSIIALGTVLLCFGGMVTDESWFPHIAAAVIGWCVMWALEFPKGDRAGVAWIGLALGYQVMTYGIIFAVGLLTLILILTGTKRSYIRWPLFPLFAGTTILSWYLLK